MNEELRRSLDRAAGEDPQSDLTESAWRGGRDLRRRRHTAQAVGGLAAAAVLAGAFAVGGGVLADPHAYVGPAVPTVDDTVTATAPLEVSPQPTPTTDPDMTPTTEAPATADPPEATPTTDGTVANPASPTEEAEAPEPVPTQSRGAPPGGADGVLSLGADTVEGHPLDGPVDDLVAAVTAELGEPQVLLGVVASDCRAEAPYGDLYSWDVLQITVTEAGVRWGLDSWAQLPVAVDLPGAVEMGMTAAELRSAETVVSEHTDLSGDPVLELADGTAAFVAQDGTVFRVVNAYVTIC